MVGGTLTTVSLLASVVGAGGFVASGVRVRGTDGAPGFRTFQRLTVSYVLLMVTLGVYFLISRPGPGAGSGSLGGMQLVTVQTVTYLALTVSSLLWLQFTLEYTGYDDLLTRARRSLLWALPVVAVVFALATLWLGLAGRDPSTGGLQAQRAVESAAAVLYPVQLLYVISLLGIGAALVVQVTQEYEHLDSLLGWVLGIGTFCPGVAVLLLRVGTGSVEDLFVVLALAAGFVTAPALLAAVSVFDPFDVTPAVRTGGRDVVLREIEEPILVVDTDGVVVDMNSAAERRFATDTTESVGDSIESVFDSAVPSIDRLETLELTTPDGRRHFDVSVSGISGQGEDAVGYILILTDVTEQRARKQRLEVLNRVIRHNLRNDVTAIITRSELLARRDGVEDLAAPITDVARSLSRTGEKAREVEELVGTSTSPTASTELRPLVESVVSEGSEHHPDVAVTLDVPDVAVGANQRVLRPVLRELVENACEHTDAAEPRVAVTGEVDHERTNPVSVSVADNGPGLPEQERETLVTERETRLQHGSGLGLWLVKWGSEQLNADLEFGSNDPRGTVVTLSLPVPGQTTEVVDATVEATAEHSEGGETADGDYRASGSE